MGALKPINTTTAELKRMRVQPEYQRTGLGQLMLDSLENRAKDLGFNVIELDTTLQQMAARSFTKKMAM
jgi:GNAT superfamily N-acetyltransferase